VERPEADRADVRVDTVPRVDHQRLLPGPPIEEVTTILDRRPYAGLRARAGAAHASQTSPFAGMPAELQDAFVGTDHLVRMQPPWTGLELDRALPL
jgi:hypothetical protein